MRTLPFAILLLLPALLRGQYFPAYQSSRYAGVDGIALQPASIAGSPLVFDFSGSHSFSLWNNYLDWASSELRRLGPFVILQSARPEVTRERLDGSLKRLYAGFGLGSGAMVRITPKISVASGFEVNILAHFDQVDEAAARFALYRLDLPEQHGQNYRSEGLRGALGLYQNVWTAYAHEVFSREGHRLRVGGRMKFYQGAGAMALQVQETDYRFHNKDTLSLSGATISYAHSPAFQQIGGDFQFPEDIPDDPEAYGSGFGLDLGLVYEFKPLESLGNPSSRLTDDYFLRVGISLLDLGRIRFPRSPSSQDLTGDLPDYPIRDLKGNSVAFFDSSLEAGLRRTSSTETFDMALPTALSFQADWQMAPRWYLNATAVLPFRRLERAFAFRGQSLLSLSPRFEGRWFAIGTPVSLYDGNALTAGAMMRLGPLVIASNNALSSLIGQQARGMDYFIALKVPVPQPKNPETPEEEN